MSKKDNTILHNYPKRILVFLPTKSPNKSNINGMVMDA